MKYLIFIALVVFNVSISYSQKVTIIDNDTLKIEKDSIALPNNSYLKVFLLSGFNNIVKLYANSRLFFSGNCVTSKTSGIAKEVNEVLYVPKKSVEFEIRINNKNIKRKIIIKKGYSFLYISKGEKKIFFNFTNTQLFFE